MKVLFERINGGADCLDRRLEQVQFLTGNSLKMIAVMAMVIDHTCKIVLQWLLSNYWGVMVDTGKLSWEQFEKIDYFIRFDLQSIGTIAFPLFFECTHSAPVLPSIALLHLPRLIYYCWHY